MTGSTIVSKPTGIVIAGTLLLCCFSQPAQAQLLDPVLDAIAAVQAKVNDIQTKVTNVRDDVSDSADQLAASLKSISQDVRNEISASLSEIADDIQDLKADRAAFNANAGVFKTDLVNMFSNLEGISGEVAKFTGLPVTFEFGTERALVDKLPDRALGPLFQALTGGAASAFTTFVARLDDAKTELHELNQITSCENMLQDPDHVLSVVGKVRGVASGTKLLGKILIAKGQTGISGKPVQLWGFAGVLIENNRMKKFGNLLDGLSDLTLTMASSTENKLRYCTLIAQTNAILAQFSKQNLDLTNLDAPISTRASQSSLDALDHSVHLALDSFGHLGDEHAFQLRLQVEEALADGQKKAAVYQRPASRQGLLEVVREVTQDTIVQQQILRGPIGNAWELLWQGDAAMAGGNYGQAYDLFGRAYRSAAK